MIIHVMSYSRTFDLTKAMKLIEKGCRIIQSRCKKLMIIIKNQQILIKKMTIAFRLYKVHYRLTHVIFSEFHIRIHSFQSFSLYRCNRRNTLDTGHRSNRRIKKLIVFLSLMKNLLNMNFLFVFKNHFHS